MVKAVIFDLYGVLAINGWQAFKAAHFAEREEVWDQVFRLGRQVDAGLSDYAELVRFTAEASGETEETVHYQLEHTVANTELLDFIRAELKGRYKLGILSNASNDEIIGRIFTEEQQHIFDTITLSHHVGMTKPDVHMYEVVADKLDTEPEACVFIDDQERHAEGARAAGMQAFVYKDTTELKKELATLLTNS
jgi:HAD superfamily hydrolase (TIGR01509 family)